MRRPFDVVACVVSWSWLAEAPWLCGFTLSLLHLVLSLTNKKSSRIEGFFFFLESCLLISSHILRDLLWMFSTILVLELSVIREVRLEDCGKIVFNFHYCIKVDAENLLQRMRSQDRYSKGECQKECPVSACSSPLSQKLFPPQRHLIASQEIKSQSCILGPCQIILLPSLKHPQHFKCQRSCAERRLRSCN